MKALFVCVSLTAVALCGQAAAQSNASSTYIQLNVGSGLTGNLKADGHDAVLGPVSVSETLKAGGMGSLLVGRRLGDDRVSVEAEGVYLNNAIGSPDLNAALGVSAGLRAQTYGGLANLKFEAPVYSSAGLSLSPYAAGGVGYGHQDLTILGDHYTGDGVLWQIKAGLAFQTSSRLAWDLGYRYMAEPTFNTNKLGLVAKFETNAHVVSVGVRYLIK